MSGRDLLLSRSHSFTKKFLRFLFFGTKRQNEVKLPKEDEEDKNPYLFELREIMEQILERRKISYDRFIPILIDGDNSEYALLAAKLLGKDLNRLVILTDTPAYFEEYADNMYEEQGLIAEIFPKDPQRIAELSIKGLYGNVILDFEETREDAFDIKFGKKIYIPIFKKKWECTGNLDIAVPIGYNIMIVRASETARKPCYTDKFEQAFYENES